MKVIRGRDPDAPTEKRSGTFTGEVWGTPVLPSNQVQTSVLAV